MRSRFMRFNALITFSLVFVLSTAAFADTIRLKDGSIVKGRITTFGGGKFVVTVGEGTRRKEMSFMADEVESIQFDQRLGSTTASNSVSQPVSNAKYIPPTQPARKSPQVVTTDTPTRPPASVSPTKPQLKSDPVAAVKPSYSGVKPIEIAVSVQADNTSNGWTNSGWVVKKGQKITISGDGEISLGGGKTTGPSGSYDIEDAAKLLKSVPTGALIAVIGDDNNDFIYIGTSREFTASRDGALFLGVNEGNLSDNSGKFSVKVEIDPNMGG
ncbi:MAG: LecA/PA-IL family lectin [Acidobacteriota bacterium]